MKPHNRIAFWVVSALIACWLPFAATLAHADHAVRPGHEARPGHELGPAPSHEGSVARAFGDDGAEGWADPFPAEALVKDGARPREGCPALLNHRIADLRGRTVDLCAFSGQVLLVVNTASYCGYTPQYEGLQALYETYRDHGLVVMGFPSNDFGAQEPGSNGDIAQFCEANYGVRFPMFSKVPVKGAGKTPFFAGLTQTGSGTAVAGEIRWNFEKFLIGRDGKLAARFRTRVTPQSARVVAAVESALAVN